MREDEAKQSVQEKKIYMNMNSMRSILLSISAAFKIYKRTWH